MKKLIALLLIVAFTGIAVFADDAAAPAAGIKLGGWGRMGYVIAAGDNTSAPVTTGLLPGWSGSGPFGRVGFNLNGTSANIGFTLNIDSNGQVIGFGDQVKIWAKLADFIQVEVGRVQYDALRGKIGDDGYLGGMGEDNVFTRIQPNPGLVVELTPVEGLVIAASLPAGYFDSAKVWIPYTTAQAFSGIQAQAGYTIKDIGTIRAQYIGGALSTDSSAIQFAFALTAVPGLLVDLGSKIDITANNTSQIPIDIYATYGADALSLKGQFELKFGGAASDWFKFATHIGASYTVAAPLTVGATVDFASGTGGTSSSTSFTVTPYAKLGYSNGYGLLGFQFTSANNGTSTYNWSIPVGLEYWF
jgi:hypothetical protein